MTVSISSFLWKIIYFPCMNMPLCDYACEDRYQRHWIIYMWFSQTANESFKYIFGDGRTLQTYLLSNLPSPKTLHFFCYQIMLHCMYMQHFVYTFNVRHWFYWYFLDNMNNAAIWYDCEIYLYNFLSYIARRLHTCITTHFIKSWGSNPRLFAIEVSTPQTELYSQPSDHFLKSYFFEKPYGNGSCL